MSRILTRRLVLRGLQLKDYAKWRAAMNPGGFKLVDESGRSMTSSKLSATAFRKIVARHGRLRERDEVYAFGVFRRGSGALVGIVDLGIIRRDMFAWANLGYSIYASFRGNGYATEAAAALLKHGFLRMKLRRIEAAIESGNRASIAVARNIGMRRECIRRAFWSDAVGPVDAHVYVSIAPDLER